MKIFLLGSALLMGGLLFICSSENKSKNKAEAIDNPLTVAQVITENKKPQKEVSADEYWANRQEDLIDLGNVQRFLNLLSLQISEFVRANNFTDTKAIQEKGYRTLNWNLYVLYVWDQKGLTRAEKEYLRGIFKKNPLPGVKVPDNVKEQIRKIKTPDGEALIYMLWDSEYQFPNLNAERKKSIDRDIFEIAKSHGVLWPDIAFTIWGIHDKADSKVTSQ